MPSMSVIEQGFCRSAPWRGFARKVILPWALHGLEPHGELLELGAGSGAMADGMARTFPELQLTVTDIDPAMVAAARKYLGARPNVRVEQADVTDLPFADSTFDVVTSYLMLHHVIEWRRALSEASRVLRPGVSSSAMTSTRPASLPGYTSQIGRRTDSSLITSCDPLWSRRVCGGARQARAWMARRPVQGPQAH